MPSRTKHNASQDDQLRADESYSFVNTNNDADPSLGASGTGANTSKGKKLNVEQELDDRVSNLSFDADRLAEILVQLGQQMLGFDLYEYQIEPAHRVIYSMLVNDGADISMLFSRQSGKSQDTAFCACVIGITFPLLAKIYPKDLGQYANGVKMGLIAPQLEQVDTVYSRCMAMLWSEPCQKFMSLPDINDAPQSKVFFKLKNGSFLKAQSGAKQSKIESKTYHIVWLEEAQDIDDEKVRKSILPMLAATYGTIVRVGTPNRQKCDFYHIIQKNKKNDAGLKTRQEKRTKRRHFEYDYKTVIRYKRKQFDKDGQRFHLLYEKSVARDKESIGEKSEEFRMSYCVAPATNILTADLRHVRADSIKAGDVLVGFDENRPGKGMHRRLKKSVVEDVSKILRPCYRLTLSDGTSVICSEEHQWLVITAGKRTEWKQTKDLQPTDKFFKICDVWGYEENYQTGYLAAAYEGEGHLCHVAGHTLLGFSQRNNSMLAKVRSYLGAMNFKTWTRGEENGTNKDVTNLMIAGGRAETMRFLGQVRPQRLLDKLDIGAIGTIGRHVRDGEYGQPYIVEKKYLGEQEVIAMRTSTRTYVAEGLASHNCLEWMHELGMFTTEEFLAKNVYDNRQSLGKWMKGDFVVAGLDIASARNSTVLTLARLDTPAVDFDDRPKKTLIDWIEMSNTNYEIQLAAIADALMEYDVKILYGDYTGVGRALMDSLIYYLGEHIQIIPYTFTVQSKSDMWKRLDEDFSQGRWVIPASKAARQKDEWKNFDDQMTHLQKYWRGSFLCAEKINGWKDDFCDSLGLCGLAGNHIYTPPQIVEVTENFMLSGPRMTMAKSSSW